MILWCEAQMDDQNWHATLPVVKLITVTAVTTSLVAFITLKCGLMTIERSQMAKLTQRIHPMRGIHVVRTSAPFRKLVTIFSKKPVVLHEQMCIALS